MMQSFAERVYLTLNGQMEEWAQVPGVENLFEDGKYCQRRYEEIYSVYQRLCDRLGVENEDADVKSMINAFMDIERELCIRMFAYGAKLGTKAKKKIGQICPIFY